MPIWDIKCDKCGKTEEIFRKIANMNDLPECCGQPMKRDVCAPFVPQEFQPYKSMIDGSIITDRGQHRRHLKANKCFEVGNEKITPKRHERTKQEKEALRMEISQRLEGARA